MAHALRRRFIAPVTDAGLWQPGYVIGALRDGGAADVAIALASAVPTTRRYLAGWSCSHSMGPAAFWAYACIESCQRKVDLESTLLFGMSASPPAGLSLGVLTPSSPSIPWGCRAGIPSDACCRLGR